MHEDVVCTTVAGPIRWSARHMSTRHEIGQRCVDAALEQFGVISAHQAIECGMSMSAVQRRVKAGMWVTLHPGVYRLRECSSSWEQSIMAACVWGGHGTVASHRAAARLLGLGLEQAPVEVIAPTSTRSRKPMVIHRTDCLPRIDVTSVRCIPVTTASRTLVDLGAVAPLATVERALEAALREGLTSLPYLADRLDQLGKPGRRGVGKLRRALRERDPRLAPTESELESLLWQVMCREGLPLPERQFCIYDATGLIGRVDFCYPSERLVIEAIGLRWHSGDRVLADGERRNRLVLAGWRVLEFPWRDVVRRRRVVAQQIRAALRATVVANRP